MRLPPFHVLKERLARVPFAQLAISTISVIGVPVVFLVGNIRTGHPGWIAFWIVMLTLGVSVVGAALWAKATRR